jgi:hypothetical protein
LFDSSRRGAAPWFALPPSAQAPLVQKRKLQIENSILGKILRRWIFLYRFMLARTQSDAIRRLESLLGEFFEHEWIERVRVRLRFLPGAEERELRIPWPGNKYLLQLRLLPWREQGCPAHWGAPIAVTVSKKSHEGPSKTVRYMSLFIRDDVIHIVQLQGISSVEMPKGLRDWAERCVRACMEFARKENFRAVRLARSESLYSYHNPAIPWYFPPKERARATQQIRARIEKHHDATARSLGFTPETDWFRWENSDFRPSLSFASHE